MSKLTYSGCTMIVAGSLVLAGQATAQTATTVREVGTPQTVTTIQSRDNGRVAVEREQTQTTVPTPFGPATTRTRGRR